MPRQAGIDAPGAGRRPALTGDGLIRSAGGWRAIRAAYKAGIRLTMGVEREGLPFMNIEYRTGNVE